MHCPGCQRNLQYGHCPTHPYTGPPCDLNWRNIPEAIRHDAVRTAKPATAHRLPLEASLRVHYML